VNGADDKGYAASNTLAGTRINSKLEDIAGSVSVVTKQQLIDTAAIDINDIFMYEVGTEGTRQFTDLTSDGRGDYDNVAGNPTGSNRVRGLSAANIAVDGFAASSSIPIDTYNISAVEIARGANSSLAGVGEAGGTVNVVQNRAALTRSTTSFTTRVDSYDGFRFTLDLNRPLFRNKLALRVSAAYEEMG
jgi:outer membrane receptor for ferric coprogen and ferric-rhodotorulic acid